MGKLRTHTHLMPGKLFPLRTGDAEFTQTACFEPHIIIVVDIVETHYLITSLSQ